MLCAARLLGDELVLILTHDAHNRKPNAIASSERHRKLETWGIADQVLVGRPDSFVESLRRERPDIVALGYDQWLPDGDTEKAMKDMGIELRRLPWFPGKEEAL